MRIYPDVINTIFNSLTAGYTQEVQRKLWKSREHMVVAWTCNGLRRKDSAKWKMEREREGGRR